MEGKKTELRVEETGQRHVGEGRAIVDPAVIAERGWETGQILEVVGGKKTYAKLWPGAPGDHGAGTIRIDGMTRRNAGAGIGERVSVTPVEVDDAQKVTVSTTQKVVEETVREYMAGNYLNHVLTQGDVITARTTVGGQIQFVIKATRPSGPVRVTDGTEFALGEIVQSVDAAARPAVTYDDLGGMREEVLRMREMVELPLRHPELFERVGVEAPKGVLLHGPPGTGKTLLARAVAGETNSNFVHLSGPEIMAKHYGESEERLRDVFKEAQDSAPSVIFIDELDSIAPKRDDAGGELERRIVSQLLTLMDGITPRGRVVVIAATNRPDSIDPALRRPGRFDREIEIGVPDAAGRLEILNIHTRGMPLEDRACLERVASAAHGFTGADLGALAREAAMGALRRVLPEIDPGEGRIPAEALQKVSVGRADLEAALREASPSALREVLVQVPDTPWEDVGGNGRAKAELREAIEWPVKHREAFEASGAAAPRGILLHGPPGTGKTLTAKAVASTSGLNFIGIKGPELLSKWVGESERGVREIFRKARQAAPCVVLFDEIDAIAPVRGSDAGSRVTDSVVSQLLTEIDGLAGLHGVLVMGATNRPDMIDAALLRPGRFDRIIEVPLPDAAARRQILEIHTRNKPLEGGIDLAGLAEAADGLSGAEIAEAANAAALEALRRQLAKEPERPKGVRVTRDDLAKAIKSATERTGRRAGGSGALGDKAE